MKKSLVALAALAATGAFAQSNVTLSGTLSLTAGTVSYNGAPTRADIGRASGAVTLSGTEDLGGGLKAGFTIQQGMYGWTTAGGAATTSLNGNSVQNFGDRQVFATLSSGFGTVKIGRDLNAASSTILGLGKVDGTRAPSGMDDAAGKDSVYIGNIRSTSLSYITPTIGGFSAYVGFTPQNYAGLTKGSNSTTIVYTDASSGSGITTVATPATTSTKQDIPVAFGAVYNNGPIAVGLDVTNYQEAVTGTNFKVNVLAGSYDLGVAKLGAVYQTAKSDAKANTHSTILSVSVPVSSALSLGAAYGKRSATTNGAYSANETKHTQLAANYALSKRTTLYVAFNKKDVGGAAVTTNDLKEVGAGIAHTF